MKKTKDLTTNEFMKYSKRAANAEVSEFAKFHSALNGYDLFTRKGIQIDKWDAWACGYTNADLILNNSSHKIICKQRELIES